LPTPHLAALVQRAVAVQKYPEKVIHPRRPTPDQATKRLVATVVAILSVSLVFIPIPLSNIVPALVIALISLAYVEEDGLLLLVSLMAAAIVLTIRVYGVMGDDPGRKMDHWFIVENAGITGTPGEMQKQ
jgi:hypothetical protein